MKYNDKNHAGPFFLLLANLIFYLAFPVIDGPVWCKDSLSYTTMDVSREPLYPLFLKLFRDLFGDGGQPYGQPLYLFVAALVQSAIAAIVVWRVILFFGSFSDLEENRKAAALSYGIAKGSRTNDIVQSAHDDKALHGNDLGRDRKAARGCRSERVTRIVLEAGALASFWGVQLLCRFAAQRGSAYPESIMTESLGMSLWLLFLMSACRFFQTHQKRYLAAAIFWMILCISLRKQLLVCVIVFAGFAFIYELFVRRTVRFSRRFLSFLAVIVSCAVSFGAATLADYGYNYAVRGVWMQHTGNAMGIDCTLLYTTTAEDADLFGSLAAGSGTSAGIVSGRGDAERASYSISDNVDNTSPSNIREVFLAIQSQMAGRGLRYVDNPAGASWADLAEHYALSYDVIGYEIMNPVVDAYVEAQYPSITKGSPQYYQAVDTVEGQLRDGLLRQNPARYLKVAWANFLEGLVNTNLRMSSRLIPVSFALYGIFLVLLVILQLRDRGLFLSQRIALFAWLTLAAIAANCAVVGAVIFSQTRYTIYNMGLFYATLWLLFVRLCRKPSRG